MAAERRSTDWSGGWELAWQTTLAVAASLIIGIVISLFVVVLVSAVVTPVTSGTAEGWEVQSRNVEKGHGHIVEVRYYGTLVRRFWRDSSDDEAFVVLLPTDESAPKVLGTETTRP